MSNPPEQHSSRPGKDNPEADQLDKQSAGRRSFTRKAMVGGAVMFSLGNRSAWGAQFDVANECLSVNHWLSYNPTGDNFRIVSAHPENLTPNGTPKDMVAQNIENAGIAANSPQGFVCPKPGNQVMDQGGDLGGTSWQDYMDP